MQHRKVVLSDDQASVLTASRRRCAICFGLKGSLKEKAGQIAHLDHDPANSTLENLVFLCLPCHDRYDSKTRQSKGLTQKEVQFYRDRLYLAVKTGVSLARDMRKEYLLRDKKIFRKADSILSESDLTWFLDYLTTNDTYSRQGIRPLDEFVRFYREVGNWFLFDEVILPTKDLLQAIRNIQGFVARNFFAYPDRQDDSDDFTYALYPNLNVDRQGSGRPEEMNRYDKYADEMVALSKSVRAAYKRYRLAIKRTLLA